MQAAVAYAGVTWCLCCQRPCVWPLAAAVSTVCGSRSCILHNVLLMPGPRAASHFQPMHHHLHTWLHLADQFCCSCSCCSHMVQTGFRIQLTYSQESHGEPVWRPRYTWLRAICCNHLTPDVRPRCTWHSNPSGCCCWAPASCTLLLFEPTFGVRWCQGVHAGVHAIALLLPVLLDAHV